MKIHIRQDHEDDKLILQKELKFVLPNPCKVLAYYNDNGFMISALTNHTFKTDVEVSGMAKGKWYHPDIYAHLLGYIFNDLGVKRISFKVETDNQACIDLLEKAGCVRECKLRGLDIYLYSMLREDYYVERQTEQHRVHADRG